MSHLLALYMGSLILRSLGIALIAGICSWKIRNVAIRHAVWVIVLVAVLVMPAADYVLPASWVPARIQQIAAENSVTLRIPTARKDGVLQNPAPPTPSVPLPARTKPVDLWSVAATLYTLIAFAMFIRLAVGYQGMRLLRRTGKPIASSVWESMVASLRNRWRSPVLLESQSVQVPMTIGLLRPAVILPVDWKNWDNLKMEAVLLHEVAHVRRVDWGIAVLAAAMKCAYWLNPLSWFLERKLSQLAELASDDASLTRTQSSARYAEILLEFAAATQNCGRLMKGGVAMAQSNMKARIERVLGNRRSGTGVLKMAGWVLMIIAAAPVIYVAAALRVASEPPSVPIPASAAALGRTPSVQTPAAGQQATPSRSPATAPQVPQNSSNPAAELQDPFQTVLEYRDIQRKYEELKQKLAQAQLAANQVNGDQPPDVQRAARIAGSVAFLQDQLNKAEEQLRTLQAAMQQPIQANPTPPSALLDLPGNRDDLVAYLNQLASRRMMPNSFSVSLTRIQGRTIFMKVSEQAFSFGCESCSFFVGESIVSSAASAPPGPGMMIQLSPDGNELTVTCRATLCNMGFEDGDTGQPSLRKFVSGDSDTFAASNLRSVVISKD